MKLPTLEEKKKRVDMTKMYKFLERFYEVNTKQFFKTGNARSVRGHNRKLSKKQVTKDVKNNSIIRELWIFFIYI